MPYNIPSALSYVVGGGLLIYLNSLIHISNLWVAVPFHLALFGLFVGCIVVTEWDTIGDGLARLKRPDGAQKSPTS